MTKEEKIYREAQRLFSLGFSDDFEYCLEEAEAGNDFEDDEE